MSPTFPRFFDLPAEIKLEVLYASLDSRERIVDPDLSAPRWPEASECFQPVSIHDYQKQARFLKHARNLSQVNKYFQEEGAKRLLRDVKVVLNHSVCTNEAAWCTCDHLHWSETLRHLRQPGLTTPPGPTEACQLYPRDPSSQLEFFDSIRCGYQQHSNQVRPDHTELVAIGVCSLLRPMSFPN